MSHSRISPEVQSILDQANFVETELMKAVRAQQASEARTRRARQVWLRVSGFRDRAIPDWLTGEALSRRYAELIVDLGKVLVDDGWQADVDAVKPGSTAKQVALETLRRAMELDTDAVTALVEAQKETLFCLGLAVRLCFEGELMNEVLHLEPPAEYGRYKGKNAEAGAGAATVEESDGAQDGRGHTAAADAIQVEMVELEQSEGSESAMGTPIPPAENPYLALDRCSRTICEGEVAELCWRPTDPFPFPWTTNQRREAHYHRWNDLARSANHAAKKFGVPLPELEERLRSFGKAVIDLMNEMGNPWWGFEQGGSWEPAIHNHEEVLRRIEACQAASSAVGRLVEYHAEGALPGSTGAGQMPSTWEELAERVGDNLTRLIASIEQSKKKATGGMRDGAPDVPPRSVAGRDLEVSEGTGTPTAGGDMIARLAELIEGEREDLRLCGYQENADHSYRAVETPSDWQKKIDYLWDFWRYNIRNYAPPERPTAINNSQEFHDALDRLQRALPQAAHEPARQEALAHFPQQSQSDAVTVDEPAPAQAVGNVYEAVSENEKSGGASRTPVARVAELALTTVPSDQLSAATASALACIDVLSRAPAILRQAPNREIFEESIASALRPHGAIDRLRPHLAAHDLVTWGGATAWSYHRIAWELLAQVLPALQKAASDLFAPGEQGIPPWSELRQAALRALEKLTSLTFNELRQLIRGEAARLAEALGDELDNPPAEGKDLNVADGVGSAQNCGADEQVLNTDAASKTAADSSETGAPVLSPREQLQEGDESGEVWLTYEEASLLLEKSKPRVSEYVKNGTLMGNGKAGKQIRVSSKSVTRLALELKKRGMQEKGKTVMNEDREEGGPSMTANPARPSLDVLAERASRGKELK